jgi:murein DD-endopeptidase MepM/ murein hydrolase activator NlpD
MADDSGSRRFPSRIRGGNGVDVTYSNGVYSLFANLQKLSVTPAGQTEPVNLADTLAYLITNNPGQSNVTTIDDGFYDVAGTPGTTTADDGYF